MKNEGGVEAVDRAMRLLECLGDGGALTLTELSRRAGLYKSTALRLSQSLRRAGMMTRDEEGRFRLGPALWRLGSTYRCRFDDENIVRPALVRLAANTGETASYYVRDGDARICLYREEGPRAIRHHLAEGARFSLDRGAAARVLRAWSGGPAVAQDAATRADGWAASFGERDAEVAAVAAPVLGEGGHLRGALCVSGPIGRFDAETARREAVSAAVSLSAAFADAGQSARRS